MRIQVCVNEKGPGTFQRADNYEIVKVHWWNLKIFLSGTIGPISKKPDTKHSWVKWTQGITFKDHSVKEMIIFFSPNQCYDKIIALSKCVYCFKLVSQVSDMAHGPLVKRKSRMKCKWIANQDKIQ